MITAPFTNESESFRVGDSHHRILPCFFNFYLKQTERTTETDTTEIYHVSGFIRFYRLKLNSSEKAQFVDIAAKSVAYHRTVEIPGVIGIVLPFI